MYTNGTHNVSSTKCLAKLTICYCCLLDERKREISVRLTFRMADEKYTTQREDTFRCAAFLSISLSTFATLVCTLAIPIFCNYLQTVNVDMRHEIDFCKQRTENIWQEVIRTQVRNFAVSLLFSKYALLL